MAPVLLFALAVAMLVTAYGFGRSSGIFPRFIGWVFVGLTLLEVIVQLKRTVADGETYRFDRPLLMKQLSAIGWLVVLVVMVFVLGFLVTVPLFVLMFLRLAARQSYRYSLALAAGAMAFVYGVFIGLLDYKLYSGAVSAFLG